MNNNMPATADPSARSVVNTNFGITNIVSLQDSKQHILDTLDKCTSILKEHCGPFSGYAMLINGYGVDEKFEPSIFTRDGIRVLSSVEFISPLEKYIKNMLTYIGSRVDNYAKDGTTTSMLFSSLFLSKFLSDYVDTIKQHGLSNFIYDELLVNVFEDVKRALKTYEFTLNRLAGKADDEVLTDAEAIKAASEIAYIQAYSSSGGNGELADVMKQIFAASPRVAWDFITYNINPKESEKAYSVDVPDYDAKLKCVLGISTDGILNESLGSEYKDTDVRVFIHANALLPGSMKTVAIMEYLSQYPTDKSLVFITMNPDPTIVRQVTEFNNKRAKPISLWVYYPEIKAGGQQYPWELMLTNAVCGCEPFESVEAGNIMSDTHTFVAKKVHYRNSHLYIYDTVEADADSCIHPFYSHPEKATQYYKDMRKVLEDQIEMTKADTQKDTSKTSSLFMYFMEMYNRLACIHRPTLLLGGTVHEQVANADVVQDVLGAVMSSIKHGFVVNGPLSIFNAVHDASATIREIIDTQATQLTEDQKNNKETTISLSVTEYFTYVIYKCMNEALLSIIQQLYGEHMFTDEQELDMKNNPDKYFNIISRSVTDIRDYISEDYDGDRRTTYPVAHPVAIYTELFKRVKELLFKFINTNKIVVAGGVVVDKEK